MHATVNLLFLILYYSYLKKKKVALEREAKKGTWNSVFYFYNFPEVCNWIKIKDFVLFDEQRSSEIPPTLHLHRHFLFNISNFYRKYFLPYFSCGLLNRPHTFKLASQQLWDFGQTSLIAILPRISNKSPTLLHNDNNFPTLQTAEASIILKLCTPLWPRVTMVWTSGDIFLGLR